jgi:hypothetical protein
VQFIVFDRSCARNALIINFIMDDLRLYCLLYYIMLIPESVVNLDFIPAGKKVRMGLSSKRDEHTIECDIERKRHLFKRWLIEFQENRTASPPPKKKSV